MPDGPRVTADAGEAAAHLLAGRPTALPTETVYGLAARVGDVGALEAVFRIKGRPLFDPLIVHVGSVEQARGLAAEWPEEAEALARRYWPGPVTVVVRKVAGVPDLVTAGMGTVALRSPDHALTLRVIEEVGPVAAPSANRFGRTSPTTAGHVLDEFPDVADLLVLDGGAAEAGIESTIVDVSGEDGPVVLRPGPVTAEELSAVLGREVVDGKTVGEGGAMAPGRLDSHYAPGRPLVLVEGEGGGGDVGAAVWGALGGGVEGRVVELALDDDPVIAARTLYAELRRLSAESGVGAMYAVLSPGRTGAGWRAIRDRLTRAASARVEV